MGETNVIWLCYKGTYTARESLFAVLWSGLAWAKTMEFAV
jgi:hypothetical protein